MDRNTFYKRAAADSTGPLAGLQVLDITTSWAGPMAACLLADMGADVIKIEHPDGEIGRLLGPHLPSGDGLSLLNETVNRNKRNLGLDMHAPEGRAIVLELAAKADVVVENFKPGTLAEWGLGYDDVATVNPAVVYVSISGFGQFGPHRHRAGYDPLVQAQSGWMSLNGEIDGGPVKAPTFLGDDLAGLHAAMSALAALRHRDQTGEGQHVDVALFDAILGASNMFPSMARVGIPCERSANQFPLVAPFNTYECRDGWVFLGMSLNPHWKAMCDLMDTPDLVTDARFADTVSRTANREAVDAIVAQWCAQQSQAFVVQVCGDAGLPVAPVHDFPTAVADPNIEARALLQETELRDGQRVPLLGPVAKFSRTPTRVRTAAHAVGEDNEAILASLGLSADGIAELRSKRVIT